MANAEAEEYKKKGNEAFQAKSWDEAIKQYNKAISLDPNNATYYSNRSACWSMKGNHESALADANKCLSSNPTFAKGYARKGKALFDLNRWDEAEAAYREGLAVEPSNAGCKTGIEDITAARRRGSSRAGAAAGGGTTGSVWNALQGVLGRFKRGGRLQTYMVMFLAYYAFNALTGRTSKSSTSAPDRRAAADDDGDQAGGQLGREFMELSGSWVSYLRAGSGSAASDTLVLLLHRTSLSAEAEFSAMLEQVAKPTARLLAPDRPCHGFSPCSSSGALDEPSWLSALLDAQRVPRNLAIAAAGQEAAALALKLAGQRPEVSQLWLLSPTAAAPAAAGLTSARQLGDWLASQPVRSAQAAADSARWAAWASQANRPAGGAGLKVGDLPKGCQVSILYGADDAEDDALVAALEARGAVVRVSTAGSAVDALAGEVQQLLAPDAAHEIHDAAEGDD